MEDSQIIEQFFSRSEDAIRELDQKYGRLCHSLAYHILNNSSDSEECVNDAYLGIWNSIPPNRPESLSAYLCGIVRNLSLKRYRFNNAEKRNSHFDVALEELDGCLADSSNVEQQIETGELSKAIGAFLADIKKLDRVIFMRRYYFSDSYSDIAAFTGITEKNVSVRLNRTRNKLRQFLKEQGYIL